MQIKKLISKSELNPLSKRTEFILLGLCLVIASSIFTYSTWGGLIWTSDSFHYWAASKSFANEGVFLSHGGGSYVYWPPLFPIILSFFTESGYHIFQGLMLNMIIIGVYFLVKLFHAPKIALLITFLFTISVYPYLISSFLWSETAFMFLMLGGLYFYRKYEISNKNILLFLSIIIFSLMCLQRNAGIFIMMGISFHAFYKFIQKRDLKRLAINAFAIFICVLPNILWNINRTNTYNNYDIADHNYFHDIIPNLKMISIHLYKAILPSFLPDPLIFALLLIILLLAIVLCKNKIFVYLLIIYFGTFSIFPLIDYGMNDRFLTPIVIFFYLILLEISQAMYSKKGNLIKWGLLLSLLILFSYNILRTYNNVTMWHERSITNPKASKIFF